MRRYKKSAAVMLQLLGLAALMGAQDIPGYTLQESLLVPVTGDVVSSQTTLLPGVHYKLRALGTAQTQVPGPHGIYDGSDAEYAFGLGSPLLFTISIDKCSNVDIGLAVNNTNNGPAKTPSWGQFNAAHTYTADFTGTGGPIAFNYHNCTYAASRGLLTVQIFRPMGMTLPLTNSPSYTDVSPGLQTFPKQTQQSVSGRANTLAVAADGMRLYAGTFAGVWRSDDGGVTWRQLTQAQPLSNVDAVPGALFAPDVYDLAISPQNPGTVMAGVEGDLHSPAMNGIYRSEDDGNTWTLVKQFACSSGGEVPQIVFAPDDPNLVYAAAGCAIGLSHDGGKSWTEETVPPADADPSHTVWHVAVGTFEPPINEPLMNRELQSSETGTAALGIRRVYAVGYNQVHYSTDGGQTWTLDTGSVAVTAVATKFGDPASSNSGNSPRVIVVEPGNNRHLLLAVPAGASNGPIYYSNQCSPNSPVLADGTICNSTPESHCGEGSLWLGDFSGFIPSDPTRQAAAWTQLPSPPTYRGVTSPSGNSYLYTQTIGNSYLLFFSDKSHVHVSAGLPTATGWHRMEGLDASQTAPPHPPNPQCNNLFVHVDPHAIAFTPNFSVTLQAPPRGTPAPYNQNKVAGPGSAGDIWMANDGGVYRAVGAQPPWSPANGLSTLATINVAGLAVSGHSPQLFFGTGDNIDFFSPDGGSTWKTPINDCGDCDAWFADSAQPHQVMGFMPLASGGGFYVFTNAAGYPDAGYNPTNGTTFAHWVCPADCNVSSAYWSRGYRPMILTPAGTSAPPTGDYIVIGTTIFTSRVVFRKTNATPMTAASDWEDTAKAAQYGPPLPPCPGNPGGDCIDVVQSSGGHDAPVLFAGDPAGPPGDRTHFLTLWKWSPGSTGWQQIVPSPNTTPAGKTAANAYRFFVDPFNPNIIYLLDDDAVKRSDDGGLTWSVDVSLDNAVTENHRYSYFKDVSVIKDIIFVREENSTRFAVGNAGVFYTLDGKNWQRLLSTSALPSHPVAAYFDNISDPCDRALYVGLDGRGVLRIDPIPPPGDIENNNFHLCVNQVITQRP